MPARFRPRGDPPPQYGPLEELFSVEINHGGLFCGHGTNKTYLDCQTDYFDNCEVDTWSPLWIRDFLMELGIDADRMQVAWKLPGKGFADGLRIIASDSDTIMMTAVVPKKIVGRPSKKRRKSALELQEGAKMSKHGSISHCSLCNSVEHNKRKCPNRGMQGQALGDDAAAPAPANAPAHVPPKRKPPVRRKMVATQESAASTDNAIHNGSQSTVQQALILQSQDSQASQQSRVLMPLPESSFLARSKSALPTNLARSKAALPTNLQSTKQAKKRGAKPKK